MTTSAPGSRFISSAAAKPTLAAVIEENALIPKSPFSDNVSRTSSNKDESIVFAASQDNRKSWLEETSVVETFTSHKERHILVLRKIVGQLCHLQHRVEAVEGRRMRHYLLQHYSCLLSLWKMQERELKQVVQLSQKIMLWNSVLLEGWILYALFFVWKSYLSLGKSSIWTVSITSVLGWLVVHWLLSRCVRRRRWLYPWESRVIEWGRKYFVRSRTNKE